MSIRINTKEVKKLKLETLAGVEALIMKSIWTLEKEGKPITVYDIIEYLKEHYEKEYHRNTVRTYLTKLEKKGFVSMEWEGRYSYIILQIDEKTYQKYQIEKMQEFWFEGSWKEFVCTLTESISGEESEKIRGMIDDLDD